VAEGVVRASVRVPWPTVPALEAVAPEVAGLDVLATGGTDFGGFPLPKAQPSTLPEGGLYEPAPVLP